MLRCSIPVCLILAILPTGAEPAAEPEVVPPPVVHEVKPESAGKPTPAWIWKTATPANKEKVLFRREFELPPEIDSAAITMVCDDAHRLWVNGHDIGSGKDWKTPMTYNILPHLKPGGRNVIAVEGRNEAGSAGMALRFRATLKDGKKLLVVSDAKWLCAGEAPEGWQNPDFAAAAWPNAVIVAKMGAAPWGELIAAEGE
jgi:uncharacterized protein (DUF2237 family)